MDICGLLQNGQDDLSPLLLPEFPPPPLIPPPNAPIPIPPEECALGDCTCK
eukprot:CAMPEP_0203742372 /NCGR_PEP_ID=MMETSP0092-20131115/57814_1 /ASSEMBLY_ACC=CAM_ASM_001090 /TAXON_ID=426623 /ORGANISM="Chaetoceros affinis, Strain CCMP159" /LENGTH=50 /DNA_ID=CAMNT_0050629521 /DNA_START=38 /DNA_END=190 /DNA_ORIENTATION=-